MKGALLSNIAKITHRTPIQIVAIENVSFQNMANIMKSSEKFNEISAIKNGLWNEICSLSVNFTSSARKKNAH